MLLLNPSSELPRFADPRFDEIMRKTVEFFESMGKRKLRKDDVERTWYAEFLEFQKREGIFAALLTPPEHGAGGTSWDTWKIAAYSELLAFYGLCYWYTWQVSILGLGPIWMSRNEAVQKQTARLLREGGIFAYGLSEKEHGADIYSTEMALTPQPDGTYRANGEKYYIGNGNKAALVSTFGKLADTGEYVFFVVGTQHEKYEFLKNTVNSQSSVANYVLRDYPITEGDILARGQDAWDAALNTVNVGKYNLGWASIGISTHAFYEAIRHASRRRLYGHAVTDFPHVRSLFVDAWTRLAAMRLFARRAADYMRSASPQDRRYLLYNPMVKMKVTTQGEEVINLLWDVIAAKGFEKDMYFDMATRDIRALPKLEGTVHVNMALIVKFMANYFANPAVFPPVARRDEAGHDGFLFRQGPTKGLGRIQFHDYHLAYDGVALPNVRIFREQIEVLRRFGLTAAPDAAQQKDVDFLLSLGELFTLVAYGQLLLEAAPLDGVDDDVIDQIFDFMVRDFAKYALQLYSKPSATAAQQALCLEMIRRPVVDAARFDRVWTTRVFSERDAYEMRP
jgi:acyl-CoA dehydrogenase